MSNYGLAFPNLTSYPWMPDMKVIVVKCKWQWSWDDTDEHNPLNFLYVPTFLSSASKKLLWSSYGYHTCVQDLVSWNKDLNPNTTGTFTHHCWPCTAEVSFLKEKLYLVRYNIVYFAPNQTEGLFIEVATFLFSSLLTPSVEQPVHTVIASSFGSVLSNAWVRTDTDILYAARAIRKVTSVMVEMLWRVEISFSWARVKIVLGLVHP